MNILIAIDSFKGSLSSKALSNAIEEGILEVLPDTTIQKVPIADGGEGTFETLVEGLKGKTITCDVHGPLMEKRKARYGLLDDGTAIIEMAESSGLPLVSEDKKNPLYTTTYGVGDMIKDAIDKGARKFIIGIGGSATNDAGIGMLASLGYLFKDKYDKPLDPIGKHLIDIVSVDANNRLKDLENCEFLIACDVDNPFYGKNGAAYIYGPQKGAKKEDVKALDQGLKHFSDVIKKHTNIDISHVNGSGAAGGLGGGFMAFLNGQLKPGIDIVFEKVNLEAAIKNADIIITGEGKIDYQTVMSKAPIGVAKLAKKHSKIAIALAGTVTKDAAVAHKQGLTSMFSIINEPLSLKEAMDETRSYDLVKQQTKEIMYLIKALKHN